MARGCPTCPGGAGGVYPELLQMGLRATDAEMVLVEYVGNNPTKTYYRGVSSRTRYPFGAFDGGTERYVLREDLGGFLNDQSRFRVHLNNTSTEYLQGMSPPTEGDGTIQSSMEPEKTLTGGAE